MRLCHRDRGVSCNVGDESDMSPDMLNAAKGMICGLSRMFDDGPNGVIQRGYIVSGDPLGF